MQGYTVYILSGSLHRFVGKFACEPAVVHYLTSKKETQVNLQLLKQKFKCYFPDLGDTKL